VDVCGLKRKYIYKNILKPTVPSHSKSIDPQEVDDSFFNFVFSGRTIKQTWDPARGGVDPPQGNPEAEMHYCAGTCSRGGDLNYM
jgi:hypothetical protein